MCHFSSATYLGLMSYTHARARNLWYFVSKCTMFSHFCYGDSHVVADICYCHKFMVFLIYAFLCNICNAIIYTTQDDRGVKMGMHFCYHNCYLVLNLVTTFFYHKFFFISRPDSCPHILDSTLFNYCVKSVYCVRLSLTGVSYE